MVAAIRAFLIYRVCLAYMYVLMVVTYHAQLFFVIYQLALRYTQIPGCSIIIAGKASVYFQYAL